MNQLGRITALFNEIKSNLGFKQTKLKTRKTKNIAKVSNKSKAKSRTVKTRTSKRKSVRIRK